MRKLVFLLIILVAAACKDNRSDVGPNRADDFVGLYYTNPVKENRASFYVWVVTRKANNKLGVGYYIEDTYSLGNQGTASKKREVYFMEDVVINGDSAFTINETTTSGDKTVKLSGNGKLRRSDDGSTWIDVALDYVGADNKVSRESDRVSFQKVENLIDQDPSQYDFDYAGSYATELPEGAKTAFHNWVVEQKNNTTFSIDYKIRDKYNQGSIGELINNYILGDAKRVGSRSLSVDLEVQEEVSRDQIKIRAVGNKLVRVGDTAPHRIATVVEITNLTRGITRIEYLELRKQM